MQLRGLSALNASILILWPYTSHRCTWVRAVLFRGLIISILRPRWKVKEFMNLLGKSGPRDLNRQDEPKIERENQKRNRGRLNQESSVPICFVTIHHYAALPSGWFSFSLFYILLFSIHIANVNAAKRSAVLNNLSVNIHAHGVSFNIYLQHVSVIIHFH